MSTTSPLVHVDGVHKTFGATHALRGVDLSVTEGRTHALVGRNGAGKSTLVSVLTGLVEPDVGSVQFAGEPAPSIKSPRRWQEKVACVYQHRRLAPNLSVAENLLLGRLPERSGRVDWAAAWSDSAQMLSEWRIDVDPRREASSLSVEEAQLVEIVRALSGGSRFVILDEPTAQLVASGIRRLFDELHRLQEAGATFLYISHHLQEIDQLCQDVTVLRNGAVVASGDVAEFPTSRIVEAMVGGTSNERDRAAERASASTSDATALSVDGLVVEGLEEPVTFEVKAGETLGIAGHAGSGTRSLADALGGLLPATAGRITRGDREILISSPRSAIEHGIGFVPEDRHAQGYVPMLSIEDNIVSTVLPRVGRFGFVSPSRRRGLAEQLCASLDVACSSTKQEVGSLSGGNQQKVVLGRALASSPEVLVLVHPTAGVDVASKDTLFEAIGRERDRGAGVVVVSDEVDELKECDRVLVFVQGRLARTFGRDWNERDMVAAMEGVNEHV